MQKSLFENEMLNIVQKPTLHKTDVSRSTFYNGDCLVEMDKIADKSVDMILVDLPYGTIAQKWDVKIDFVKLWEHYERIIVDKGAILFFGSQPFTTDIINSNRKLFKYCWVWEKDRGGNIMTCKFQPYKNYEDIIVFSKKAAAQTKSGDCMNYFPIMIDRKPVTVKNYGKSKIVDAEWQVDGFTKTYDKAYPKSIQKFNNREKDYHPTQKPVPLLEYLIKTYTKEGDTVLDNTMGSGSTGVACKKTNRHFIGIEKDPKYFEIAVSRVSAYCG